MVLTLLSKCLVVIVLAYFASGFINPKLVNTAAEVAEHWNRGGEIEVGCLTPIFYYGTANVLKFRLGNITSGSRMKYGDDPSLNSQCDESCQALFGALWGHCYCENQEYIPSLPTDDSLVARLNVREMFELIGTEKYAAGATCRDFVKMHFDKVTCKA